MHDNVKNTLPDIMASANPFMDAQVSIPVVGIKNLKLPLTFSFSNALNSKLETQIDVSVSLAQEARGINMSRFVELFSESTVLEYSWKALDELAQRLCQLMGSKSCEIAFGFNYQIDQVSLRTQVRAPRFYPVKIQIKKEHNLPSRVSLNFSFLYSSVCPCSQLLSEHAETFRGVSAVPHSQRSLAVVDLTFAAQQLLTIEAVQSLLVCALKTEVQTLVKRGDEQAFAELNAEHPKFVEDAVRLLYAELRKEPRIEHAQIKVTHFESLHEHDAVAELSY